VPGPRPRGHGRLGPGDARRLVLLALALVGLAVGAAFVPGGLSIVGAAALACLAWAFLVEPRRLTVTRVRVESARLPAGSRPVRIVHVTDLQSDPRPRLEERLPDAVAAQRPDVIAFTGDAINSEAGLPVFRRCLARLAEIAPTFAVTGNWEVWNVPGSDPYGGTGARVLDVGAARVAVGETAVWVAGVGADQGEHVARALAEVPPGAPTVFLHHYPDPDVVPQGDRSRVDLMLAGHVHGGQVAVPFFGAVLTLSRHGRRYVHGLYEVGPMRLFVSRGVGMEGRAPRMRFCAPPEIAVIDLAPPG
jgi:predicted MPP superfamily phosphohydrolase